MLSGMEAAAARRGLARIGADRQDPPRADLASGTGTLPGIGHIVILMMENHSYDNYLGRARCRPAACGNLSSSD